MGAAPPVFRRHARIGTVALSGHDYPGIRPQFKVAPGQRVLAGQTLFVDRKRPHIAFTAPASGIVRTIDLGRKRLLNLLVIDIEGEEAIVFEKPEANNPDALRDVLLRSGLWPSFLTRPFARIPDPRNSPDAIFVTATDTNPLATDPRAVIESDLEDFRSGVAVLPLLTEGPVFVCTSPGPRLTPDLGNRVTEVAISGPHPSGLAGTHIHHLAPVDVERTVWTIAYQDVIAIGHLLRTGRLPARRVVTLTGPMVLQPSLVHAPPGASLDHLLDGEIGEDPARVLTGSILLGREAGYLGRYHNQVTVIARDETAPSGPAAFLGRFFEGTPDAAIIPREAFERAFPFDIPPVPLLRALSIGDVETLRALGCLELVEEDLAVLSHLCATGTNYGALLRQALDEVEAYS